MSTSSSFFRSIGEKFSSQPPVHVKIITPHDAKAGDPIWFDVENNCGKEIATITIDCANAFRNPAGMSFFRFNTLQELAPETFSHIVCGSNRLCSHYQIPQNQEEKVYLGLLVVKATIQFLDGQQCTIQKLNINALPSEGNPDLVVPSASFPPTGNYITDLPGNFFGRMVDVIKDYFSPFGRRKISRMKEQIEEERKKSSSCKMS
jgi:hypothetical protein